MIMSVSFLLFDLNSYWYFRRIHELELIGETLRSAIEPCMFFFRKPIYVSMLLIMFLKKSSLGLRI